MPMNANRAFAAIICAVLGAASSPAHAGTVNFNVPLNVTSYPSHTIEVWCELRTAQDQPVSAGMTVKNVPNGEGHDSALVKVNYTPQEAGAIRRYRCALVVETTTNLGAGYDGRAGGTGGVKSIPAGATILQQVGGPLQ
jgi:hypothetical protein